MKKCLSYLLFFCLAISLLPLSVSAAEITYNLDALGMSVDISDTHIVFTRDTESSDPNLSTYGLTKDSLDALMLEKNLYLNAWDKAINYEILITMAESTIEDFNQLSNSTLTAFASALVTEYERIGITLIESEIYQHSQAKFIKMYISQPINGETIYGLQYYTCYNDKAINIGLQSYSGKIDAEKEALLKKIVDSALFDGAPKHSDPPVQTKAFTYTDKNSGLSFVVPANWTESPMFEDREFIDAKFVSNLEDGLAIIFASEDILDGFLQESGLSEAEVSSLSRGTLNNSMVSKELVATMFGGAEDDVSMVSYGNRSYFLFETEYTASVQGITAAVPMTVLVRFENGYLYMFQFSGKKDSSYFSDFEKLVTSAKYPHIKSVSRPQSNAVQTSSVVAVIILLAILVLLVGKLKKKNKPTFCSAETVPNVKPDSLPKKGPPLAPALTLVNEESGNADSTIAFCHKCGMKLLPDSAFCSKCGSKISNTSEVEE